MRGHRLEPQSAAAARGLRCASSPIALASLRSFEPERRPGAYPVADKTVALQMRPRVVGTARLR